MENLGVHWSQATKHLAVAVHQDRDTYGSLVLGGLGHSVLSRKGEWLVGLKRNLLRSGEKKDII